MEMVHVSDWLPSLYTLAGGDIHNLNSIDGIDVWNSISSGEYSPREQILLNIDPITGEAAFRFNKWKLIVNESKLMSWMALMIFFSTEVLKGKKIDRITISC